MDPSRRTVLAATLAAVAAVTLFILKGLLGTIFFAVTVASLLHPLVTRLERRGLPSRWAAAVATATALAAGIGLFLPVGVVLYVRRRAALALLRALPDSLTIGVEEFTYVIELADVTAVVARWLTRLAFAIAEGMPVLLAKLGVFAFVVYALLYRREQLARALRSLVPTAFHDESVRLHDTTRDTLYSLYVIQAATAIATFAVALVVFLALGVRYPVTLAVMAGIFQFLPIIGPSLVIAGLVVADLVAGDLVGAVILGVVGLTLIGILPDAVLRPWLAGETTGLPASVYFVGLTGGLLSLGPVGIVAGPLVLAILLEVLAMVSDRPTASP